MPALHKLIPRMPSNVSKNRSVAYQQQTPPMTADLRKKAKLAQDCNEKAVTKRLISVVKARLGMLGRPSNRRPMLFMIKPVNIAHGK